MLGSHHLFFGCVRIGPGDEPDDFWRLLLKVCLQIEKNLHALTWQQLSALRSHPPGTCGCDFVSAVKRYDEPPCAALANLTKNYALLVVRDF